jgi:uncharacterized protein involved in exopolysaccharide biosynthesis
VFMDYLVELNRSESEAIRTYLEAELERAYEELILAISELQVFKDEHGTYSPADEFREQLNILSELEVDYEEAAAKHARLSKKLGVNHADVLGLDAEKKYLASALAQRKALLKKLPEAEKLLRLLELRIELALDAHELLRKEYLEAQIRAAQSLPEIVLVARAVPPNNPSEARYALSAFLCLFAAFTIGLLLTFLLEFFDTSIRSLEDASLALELPVLATIPPLSNTG